MSRHRSHERKEAERLLALQFQRDAEEEIRVHGRIRTFEERNSPETVALIDGLLDDLEAFGF